MQRCHLYRPTVSASSRRRMLTLLVTGTLLLAAGCAVNPVTGDRELMLYSEAQEIQMGKNSYIPSQQLQGGAFVLDPALTSYVQRVGKKLAGISDRPQLPYEFTVLNNSEPNAWALPGGKIAVNRGLLTALDSEAELAAVLGHEIVHAAARHGAKAAERGLLLQAGAVGIGMAAANTRYSDLLVGSAMIGANLINQRYSREQELEADYYGMHYMARAGYAPVAAVTLQEKFVRLFASRDPGWLAGLFASHPPSQERVDANRRTLAELPKAGIIGQNEYREATAFLQRNKKAYEYGDQAAKALAGNNAAEALKLADTAARMLPEEAYFHGLLGDAYYLQHNNGRALQEYSEAIRLYPGYYHYYQQRGKIEREKGELDKAREDLSRSTELLPSANAFLDLGLIAKQQQKPQEAMTYFRQAATSRTETGRQAQFELASMELLVTPEKYISVELRGTPDGSLGLLLSNTSPVPISRLQVTVTYLLDGSRVLDRAVYPVAQGLQAGGQYFLPVYLEISGPDLPRLSMRYAITAIDF